ncbi:MAG: class I SAM-dependent methyltransferase [Bacteroidales bacterium]|nr:class I SAM-dependent methyltransferase [Bacteroidales bacterium]
MKTNIFNTLKKLGLTSVKTRFLFNNKTRDVDNLKVWKDNVSGVIYIDDYYVGDEMYIEGGYRRDKTVKLNVGKRDYELASDAQRQYDSLLRYVAGKKVIDFGCGRGDFLRLIKNHCEEVSGIELETHNVDILNSEGINCFTNIEAIQNESIDVCVSFHTLGLLPNPLEVLGAIKSRVKSRGSVIIEVTHANDFLLSVLANDDFKQFTLCSQFLIIHTRESLRSMLEYVGFEDIRIEGIQRYPLSNHLNWLANGKAGGHKSPLSVIDSLLLKEAYANSLARINATDTLVAFAYKP